MPSLSLRHHARVLGSGPETLVFAHGFGSDQTAWRHVAATLGQRFRIVLFDHMGAGRSDPTAFDSRQYRSLWTYADDVNALLSELELDDVTYVGHSMGGMIGVLAYLSVPDRYRRLVLVGSSPRYLNDEGYTGGFGRADVNSLYAHMLENYEAWVRGFAGLAMGNQDRPELAAEFTRTLGSLRPDVALSTAQIIFEADYRSALTHCAVPSLVVQSQEDIAVPIAVGEFMVETMPQATLEVIPATGHFPHLSAPDVVTAVIERFLERAPAHRATVARPSTVPLLRSDFEGPPRRAAS